MTQKRRLTLRLEEFECRLNPAVTRAIGTLQIVDTTANPTWEWKSSPTADVAGTVIGTHTLQGSIDVSYTLTGKELTEANKIGYHLYKEEVQWRNVGLRRIISRAQYSVAIPKAPTFPMNVVIRWTGSTTNNPQLDDGGVARYHGYLIEPRRINGRTRSTSSARPRTPGA
jgi:hypothetical protein